MRDTKHYTLLAAGAPRGLGVSTNASPIVCTSDAAHGMSTGDIVQIMGHTTNTNANGIWTVTVITTTTFSLDGSTGNGVGDDSGMFITPAPGVLDVSDFKTITIGYKTDGGGDYSGTLHFVGSVSEDMPNFAATQSVTNIWDYLQAIDLEDNASLNGDEGIIVAGADAIRLFQINVDGLKWFSAIHSIGTAGELTLEATLFSNE